MTEPRPPQPPNRDAEVIGVRRGMFGVEGSGDTSGYGRLVREVALPGSSPRPYGGYFDEVVDALIDALGEDGFTAAVERVVVYPRRAHPRGAPRAPGRGRARRCATIRPCDSSCAWGFPVCTIPKRPAANCTRCIR